VTLLKNLHTIFNSQMDALLNSLMFDQ